ncbi:MAG: TonB-dependent receptor domain-containing protein [Gammaproteobacteria bacterium]
MASSSAIAGFPGATTVPCASWVARVVSIQGQVETRSANATRWHPARLEQTFCGGEMIRVAQNSRAAILLRREATTLQLDQRSTMTIPSAPSTTAGWLKLLRGAANFLSRTPTSLKITTPFLNAHIEGTEFMLRVSDDETAILVFSGRVLAENNAGRLRLRSGQQAAAKAAEAPRRYLVARPRDAVEWALYYPPVVDIRGTVNDGGIAAWHRETIVLYRRGRLLKALARLDEVSPELRDAPFFDLRAALLMSIGRVEEARSDIAQALQLNHKDATAIALRSVIALVKNQKRTALRQARHAVALEPQSPVPYVALSYAEQALFDLEAALASARRAVGLDPDNGLAWARLAELELSNGDRSRAVDAAEKATALDPKLARTQSVLGFVALARINLKDALTAFAKAILLDSADPLPRLGLGLAKIRQGDLEEGREEIEIAASLDPTQSLIRSYLGKAYYEQKRDEWARSEFAIAKGLDSKDPTPWFYEAIADQTTNRPVEALKNLQKSIALNDNRAVYRSRLLLDDDLATRNTSLGRIYTDLGFQQLAVVESAKSLSLDPANHSAHRLLSDSYSGLTRHEIARGSELLQSRLLQPITSNPVRPSRSASDIRIAGSAGPADAGFNEFSPLFERDRVRLLTSAFGGNHATWGEESVLSALYDRYAVSLGQFHSDTEGFRANNDLRQNLYDLFGQVTVTPFLDIQTEYRFQDREYGDLRLNFDPVNFRDNRRQAITEESGRLGIHVKVSPQSDMLISALYGDIENKRRLLSNLIVDEFFQNQSGYQVDTQYLFSATRFNLVAGGGVYHADMDERVRFFFPDQVIEPEPDSFSSNQYSAYIYCYLDYPKSLFWTFGLSYDSYEERNTKVGEVVNPKVGIQWNIADSLHVRLAYTETLRRALIVEQTLEPTEIAGFNQFFDDPLGSRATRYGIGLDTRASEQLYMGIEASERNIKLPGINLDPLQEEELREDLYRAYLYWTPSHRWALSAEFRLERFEVEEQIDFTPNRTISTETSTVPLTVHYFHPSGFFAGFGASYVHQEVELSVFESSFDGGSNEFVIVDSSIGYRFPNRLGIFSMGVSNLLDETFRFQDESFRTHSAIRFNVNDPELDVGRVSRFIPDRTIFAGFTLSF